MPKLSDTPVSTRFLRILMTESSNTCDEHGSDDVRNCVGYAIQEINAGSIDASGAFVDIMKDAAGQDAGQSPGYVSSSIDCPRSWRS